MQYRSRADFLLPYRRAYGGWRDKYDPNRDQKRDYYERNSRTIRGKQKPYTDTLADERRRRLASLLRICLSPLSSAHGTRYQAWGLFS
jgi:hypothetical protein